MPWDLGGIGTIIWVALALGVIVQLLLQKREPSSTIAWILLVIVVPIFGALLFLVFGPQRLERKAVKRRQEIARAVGITGSSPMVASTVTGRPGQIDVPTKDRDVFELARRISEYSVTSDNRVELLSDPYLALVEMQNAIEAAQEFIHLEYYIIQDDEVTKQLMGYIQRAAQRGVEVRILYDALGSLSLKSRYFRPLLEKGIKIAGFLPFSFSPQRMYVNFRNHRKILVVDGKIAFTGGTNIGKEYLGRRNRNQWRDYSVRVEGSACRQLEDVFAKDWHFTTGEDLFQSKYYPLSEASPGNAVVQVLESGPDSPFHSLHQALFLAINSAEREILLTTPYFIPDLAIHSALAVAALRGVKVTLLLPARSDWWLVRYASRSFYDDLLRAGVRIYEYQPRILHAKMLVIDDKWTIVGSANMDIRSFRLNFELNLLVYGKSLVEQAATMFRHDIALSKPIELGEFLRRPVAARMLENACRLLSPVL